MIHEEKWFMQQAADQVMLFGNFPEWVTQLASRLPQSLVPAEVSCQTAASLHLLGCQPLVLKAAKYVQGAWNQMTANRYHAGDQLKPHVDLHQFGDNIYILSLESEVVMTFEKAAQHCNCLLAPGDLLLLQQEARWASASP